MSKTEIFKDGKWVEADPVKYEPSRFWWIQEMLWWFSVAFADACDLLIEKAKKVRK